MKIDDQELKKVFNKNIDQQKVPDFEPMWVEAAMGHRRTGKWMWRIAAGIGLLFAIAVFAFLDRKNSEEVSTTPISSWKEPTKNLSLRGSDSNVITSWKSPPIIYYLKISITRMINAMETTKRNYLKWLAIVVCLFAASHLQAQENAGKDPLQEFLFPPELVMRYQLEIQLKKEQKELILASVDEAQKKFSRLQWDLQAEMTLLEKVLAAPSANETSVLAQLDKVLDQERMIKKAQITLLIRIKNALSDEQKIKLNALKHK